MEMTMFYKEIPVYMLEEHTRMHGKKVLEIGGGAKLESAKKFLEFGAEQVTVTNIGHGINKAEKHDKVTTMYANALHLDETFDEPFDIVYGVAVLEHIPDPEQYLQQIYGLLNPGGYVCLTGGPIWTGPLGHHLWAKCETVHYRFADRACNPIPDWGHLLLSKDEMRNGLMVNESVPPEDADKIVNWVYHTKNINRLTHAQIIESFHNSKFQIAELKENRKSIPEELHKLLKMKHGKENDYGVFGIQVVLKKEV